MQISISTFAKRYSNSTLNIQILKLDHWINTRTQLPQSIISKLTIEAILDLNLQNTESPPDHWSNTTSIYRCYKISQSIVHLQRTMLRTAIPEVELAVRNFSNLQLSSNTSQEWGWSAGWNICGKVGQLELLQNASRPPASLRARRRHASFSLELRPAWARGDWRQPQNDTST